MLIIIHVAELLIYLFKEKLRLSIKSVAAIFNIFGVISLIMTVILIFYQYNNPFCEPYIALWNLCDGLLTFFAPIYILIDEK